MEPGQAEADESAYADCAEDEENGTRDGDPSDDDEADGDDGADLGAGDGEVAEGEFLRRGGAATACVLEHFLVYSCVGGDRVNQGGEECK